MFLLFFLFILGADFYLYIKDNQFEYSLKIKGEKEGLSIAQTLPITDIERGIVYV